uniref:Gamma-glutamylcyclotransferase family protein n=1 Tax=Panagrellus redivivus TaxID=6233 RepID=A0A7E4VBG1_PANRE
MPTYRVFVYGTLKRGEPNAHIMSNPKTGKHKFVGGAVTKEAYPLFVAGQWNIPFMLGEEGKGFRIHGELYDVDEAKLKALDTLEGHPTVYQRTLRPVIPDGKNANDDDAVEEVWMYTLKSEVVKSNDNLI